MFKKPYRDRLDAGRVVASQLMRYADHPDVVVLALPRGGVPIGYEVARALDAPLDVFLVRKLGVPGQEELAMGAVATGGTIVLNDDPVRAYRIPSHVIEAVAAKELRELARRERVYREDRPPPDVEGKIVILTDDGLATGSTMLAAIEAVRQRLPASVVVAVPVAARDTCEQVAEKVDDIVCAATPEPFQAVSLWYEDFTQTTDDEVRSLLALANESWGRPRELDERAFR